MQQWEYCSATLINVNNKRATAWLLKEMNEQELPNWRDTEAYPSIVAFCNQMGSQGWELVGEMSFYRAGDAMMYFKRSRE